MKLLKKTRRVSRRGFLKGSAAAAAVVAATRGSALAQQLQPGHLTPEETRALVVFTRDLFPHDRLDDSYYQRAVKPLDDEAAKDAGTRHTLSSGVSWLNSAAKTTAGAGTFAEITDEKKRVAIIVRMQKEQPGHGSFFEKVYSTTIASLYNQPEVWPKFGYEGPSSAKGGYLHRGYNDLKWL